MIDRDSRVVFGSLLALILVLTGSIVTERQFGVDLLDYPVLSFLVFAGLALAAPQLYLAATDDADDIGDADPARSRVQFAAISIAVLAPAFGHSVDGISYLVIATVGTLAVFGLVCYEVLRWHRNSSDPAATRAR